MRFLLLVVALAGCSTSVTPDAGVDAPLPMADAGVDAAEPDAGCARTTATLGAAGGTLTHCDGARLEVPAGALAADTELFIERAVDVPAISSPYVLAGPAFRFGPETTALTAPLRVVLPHGGGERMEMAALVEDEWLTVEICESDDTTVTLSPAGFGTYAAAHDPNVYPDGPSGLGTGHIEYTFGELESSLEIEYAIDEHIGEGESLTLVFRRSDEAGLVQVDLRLAIDGDEASIPQLAHADTSVSEIWDVLDILHPGDAEVVITSHDGRSIAGTIEATLHLGEATRPFTATFEATTVEWRYPPERSCGTPEG